MHDQINFYCEMKLCSRYCWIISFNRSQKNMSIQKPINVLVGNQIQSNQAFNILSCLSLVVNFFPKIIKFSEKIAKKIVCIGFPDFWSGGWGVNQQKRNLKFSTYARKSITIFWAQTFSTQRLPGPNFFKLSVPHNLRVFQAFARLLAPTDFQCN